MIVMTSAAIEKAKSVLAERKEAGGLRIAVLGSGRSGFQYQMTLDKEAQAGDEVLDMDGLRVFVDARSMFYLYGAKVDYTEGAQGSGFIFGNPNATSYCGYGDSFEA